MRSARALSAFAVLLCGLCGSCDAPPAFPELSVPPGDFGDVRGAWVGVQEILGQRRRILLTIDQVDRTIVGRADRTSGRQLARSFECEFSIAFADIDATGGRWDAFGISVSYDAASDTLVANVAPEGIFDPSAVFTLERIDWFATGDRETDFDGDEDERGEAGAVCGGRPEPACANGIDDDGDDDLDRRDDSCCLGFGCRFNGNDESLPSSCEDGLDNDHDGRVDADDPQCAVPEDGDPDAPRNEWLCQGDECQPPDNSCTNGEDDNRNGLIDDEDPGCAILGRETRHHCLDGIDNDGDGVLDLDEEECRFQSATDEWGIGLLAALQPGDLGPCLDGVDNEDDGKIDQEDRQCEYTLRGNEQSSALGQVTDLGDCTNGLDDDGDGLTDDLDPGCQVALRTPRQGALNLPRVRFFNGRWNGYEDALVRFEGAPPCVDGLDNDGDGLIDFEDTGCRFSLDWSEGTSCTDGLDNNGDGLIDADDPSCLSEASDELQTACANGIDDDGDGLIDGEDGGCRDGLDVSELGVCEDGLDNDGDALIDAADDDCVTPTSLERSDEDASSS